MAERLPIYELENDLVLRLREHRRVVLSAPTGSGKSTQVPQMLLRNGFLDRGQAVILQPRRLATRLLATRVAAELGVPLGREVGYQIRFESVISAQTRLRYVTEGVLLRQMVQDPKLTGISALIFDEFHERHLYGDITLARALDLQEHERPDLLILVMSATLNASQLESYLQPCTVLFSEGRAFPVEIRYASQPSYLTQTPTWDQAAGAFGHYIRSGGVGDVLIFMPGGFEIAQTIEALRRCPEAQGFLLLPLHGELPPRDQDAAVARYRQPKVVVSTNVAETSLTIDGVRCIIDSGLARLPRYDPYRGLNTLPIEKISRAAADQRAGRAGRTAPGVCLRLWSEREHSDRPAQELPEVKRLELAEVVLTLKAAGVVDLRRFRWLEPPEEQSLAHAEELLADLGAIQAAAPVVSQAPPPNSARVESSPLPASPPLRVSASAITPLGRRMLAFPIHPRYARMLLAAQDYGCVYQAALVAALTQGRDLLLRQTDPATTRAREDLLGAKTPSDFWLLMRAWTDAAQNDCRPEVCRKLGLHAPTVRQVGPLLQHFLQIAQREGLDTQQRENRDEALRKCILIGFSDRLARRLEGGTLRCDLVHGRRGTLARESVVQHSPLLVAAEIREVEGQEKSVNTLLSLATAVEPEWLRELYAEELQTRVTCSFDATARRVYAQEHVTFRGLAISSKALEPPPADEAAQLLAAEVIAGRLPLKTWDDSVDQWILRLNCLSRWCPELGLPPITEPDRHLLMGQLCHGAYSYKDVRDLEVKPVVKSWLSGSQQALLDKHAPERLQLSNGRTPKVTYVADGPPFIALRIQELFDVTQTPRLALGRVPVVLHILAPSMRPVQITQDLAGFWRDHYPRIKQELQRRYPKHRWR